MYLFVSRCRLTIYRRNRREKYIIATFALKADTDFLLLPLSVFFSFYPSLASFKTHFTDQKPRFFMLWSILFFLLSFPIGYVIESLQYGLFVSDFICKSWYFNKYGEMVWYGITPTKNNEFHISIAHFKSTMANKEPWHRKSLRKKRKKKICFVGCLKCDC